MAFCEVFFSKSYKIHVHHSLWQLLYIKRLIIFFYNFFVLFSFFKIGSKLSARLFIEGCEWLLHIVLSGILNKFTEIFRNKLSHTCSLNLNYFHKIKQNSSKWDKVARNRENAQYMGIVHPIWHNFYKKWRCTILQHVLFLHK